MISTNKLTIQMGKDILFEDVSIKFNNGNSYGVIGANGSGKSTFLKVLSKELEPSSGNVFMESDKRLSFLKQDQSAYDDKNVIDTVIMGNDKLYNIMQEKNEIYLKPDFNDADGIRAGELEAVFDHLGGWDAEYDAAVLLNGLGIGAEHHDSLMKDLEGHQKVKVLLAQALFGNPDVLLLDEPTNNLDIKAIRWLENYLIDFDNTLIVVSHDRYFLNKICTHIADIDYKQITLYAGNYDFWYESSQLMLQQQKDAKKKAEDKVKELQDFIARFSANASKSRQATSRKKLLDKIEVKDIKPSTRRYPYINFKGKRKLGDDILTVENITKTIDGIKVLDNVSFIVGRSDKIAFVGNNEKAKSTLFDILMGKIEADSGTFKFGTTIEPSYFRKTFSEDFKKDTKILNWLSKFSNNDDITYIRGFLGRLLFSGEDSKKQLKVLSGGEKVRVSLSKMMIEEANLLILDEPTNHLDMEAITSLNKGLINFDGVVLFSSTDHELTQTTGNRVIEIFENGKIIDQPMTYDEYLKTKEDK